MKGVIRWRGSKTNASKIVNAAVGDVSAWYEAFGGSLALYMMYPGKPREVVLGDVNGLLVNLWRCIRYGDFEDFERHTLDPISHCDLTAWSRLLQRSEGELVARLKEGPTYFNVELGARFWWVNHCMLEESLANSQTPAATIWSGRPSKEVFRAWARKLIGAVLLNSEWPACVSESRISEPGRIRGKVAGSGAVIIDPPYPGHNIYGYPEVDHDALIKRAIELGAHPFFRVVYFGYEVDLPGWKRVGFKTKNSARKTTGMDGAYLSPHCVIGEQLDLFDRKHRKQTREINT